MFPLLMLISLSQFRLGVVELQAVPEPAEVIRELITHGLELSKHLQAKNKHLLEENRKLRREQQHISTQYVYTTQHNINITLTVRELKNTL